MRIQLYERKTGRITPGISTPQELRPPPAAFGVEAAEATQRLGETGMRIAQAIMKRAEERKTELMEKELADQDTMFRQEMQGILYNDEVDDKGIPQGFLSRKLEQAQNIAPQFDQTYSSVKTKYLNNVQDPRQKNAMSKIMDNHYISQRDSVIRHEREQTDQSIQNSFQSNLDIQINDAAQLQDGPSVIRAIQAAQVTQNTISRINGYDDKTAEAKRIEITGKVAKSAFSSAMAENNLIKAQSIYNAVKGNIPAEIEEKMKEQVESGIPYGIAIQDAFLDPISTRKKLESNAYNIKDPVKRKAAYDFTNTLAEKMITDNRETRHNDLLGKLAAGELKLVDIENELQIPEDVGGIKKSMLINYQRAVQRGIEKDLNRWLTEQDSDKDPTARAKAVKGYVDLIDTFTNDDTDKWRAREKLSEAYADGIVNSQEAVFLNKLRTNLKSIQRNRTGGGAFEAPPVNMLTILDPLLTVKIMLSWMRKNNATDEESTINIKKLLGTLQEGRENPQDTIKVMMQNHINKKIPEVVTFSPKGQLMQDGYGNQAIVYPDGTIEPIVTYKEKPKQEEGK